MMPKTVWRPYPETLKKPENKFTHAEQQRQRVIEAIRKANRPLTMYEIADVFGLEGESGYNKVRRYVVQVAYKTRSSVIMRGRKVLGWTLKEQYR
jgi:hypothetical protein